MLRNVTRVLSAGLIASAIGFGAAPAMAAPESKDPIKVTLHDWTGQLITARLMGETLKKAGYNVEYVQADYLAQFAGMKTGDLHVAMEVWATTAKEAMDAAIAEGGVENVGETGMQAIEDWWFPDYMKEKCPGLPDWQALKACAEAFSVPETAPKGRYLGGPVTWGGYDEERVQALGLDFEVVHAGTDAAMFAELQSAYERKAPIILWIYAPHWAPIKYKGEWVKFPPYEKACYEDPAWGVNKEAKYDCAKPRGPIYKAAWTGVKDKWPGAYKAIKAYTFTNDEIGALAAKVDLDGKKVEDVVDEWMAANESRWKGWLGQ
ncbi:ABC transporter [Methylopila jiangsuensis]|uniref:ABC transporter n=1 Tax=Methylopila jiangsuensis TaxID=586230 RepID=A0A9W6JCZ7_9HYPH|nr:ABC transporter substrate-binding protein [Methylopila jiangsuensis]MDR6285542.1 glycine betaine/proline transport system substrate-binding protein [Methylopila jiangsuensis]GLK75300.1 ABC transporter [Methylopila jiangsuensis]